METFIVHPESEEQQKALQVILEGFKVPFEKEPVFDTTAYLLSTDANRERLKKAIEEDKKGEGLEIKLDDLWK